MRKNYLVHHIVYPDGWKPMPKITSDYEQSILSTGWMYGFFLWYTKVKKGDYDKDYQRLKTRILSLNQ